MISDQQWAMERDAFLASPAPRRVPPSIFKVTAPEGTRTILFAGLLFLIMGLFFSWTFMPWYLPRQWRLDLGPAAAVQGTITEVEVIGTSRKKHKPLVQKYTYRFAAKDGASREGTAYTTGGRWKEGRKVKVRYLESDPSVSVPLGARMGEEDVVGSFVILFPLMGSAVLISYFVERRRRMILLSHGWIGKGSVTALERTWASVNNQPQYKIKVTRTDYGVESVMRSYYPGVVSFVTARKDAQEPVTILYDPRKPKRLMLPETWGREREIG
jgi:hypothetical protein